jgi:hypothetical protein
VATEDAHHVVVDLMAVLTAEQVFQCNALGDEVVVLVVIVVGLMPEERHDSVDRLAQHGDVTCLDAKDLVNAKRQVPVQRFGVLHVLS